MVSRRGVLELTGRAVVAAGVIAGQGASVANATPHSRRRTFVLVHGAWHGGWCWRDVQANLVADGHLVFAPTLTGLGERSHLLNQQVNLDTHIADIENVIRWEELRDVVLVGHSYAGMIIAAVADRMPDRIGSLVFLDAVLPRDGQSMSDIMPFRGIAADSRQLSVPVPPSALFGVPPEKQRWVDALCTPMPLAAARQPVRLSGAYLTVRKKIYIQARPVMGGGNKVVEALTRDRAWRVVGMDSGHDVMVAKPAELATILGKI